MADLKLGKKPASYDKRDLMFEDYRVGGLALPQRPSDFGQDLGVKNWGMLGNDRYGDCVFAGAAHETMLFNYIGGRMVAFTDDAVLGDYAAVTGFDPETGANDDGTDVHEALRYRRSTGVIDASGDRHTIGAFVSLEPGNYDHLMEAAFLFDAVAIGIAVYDWTMDQFMSGKAWQFRSGGNLEGYHYIPLVGRHHNMARVVTWAQEQQITKRFIEKCCDEAYGILSVESLRQGKSVQGYNFDQLLADLNALGSGPVEQTKESTMEGSPQPEPGQPGQPGQTPSETPAEQPNPAQSPPAGPDQAPQEQPPQSPPGGDPQPGPGNQG